MLRGMRAGIDKTAFSDPALAAAPSTIDVKSLAFEDGALIPRTHSSDGDSSSPDLSWSGVPKHAVSLALLVEDADSPTPSPFVHLVAWGLPGRDGSLPAGACNPKGGAGSGEPIRLGRNGMYSRGYTAPDPPPGHGPHRYVFQVFALSRALHFRSPPTRRLLMRELRQATIAKGAVQGIYERT